MRILARNEVWLEEGEVAPVFCACGHIYAPLAGSLTSSCPCCGRNNRHDEHVMVHRARFVPND